MLFRNAYSGATPMENAVRPWDGVSPVPDRNVKNTMKQCGKCLTYIPVPDRNAKKHLSFNTAAEQC